MPHDRKNTKLVIGDRVNLTGIVRSIDSDQPTYCNVTVVAERGMAPEQDLIGDPLTEDNCHRMALSARMLEKIQPDPAPSSGRDPDGAAGGWAPSLKELATSMIEQLQKHVPARADGLAGIPPEANMEVWRASIAIETLKCIRDGEPTDQAMKQAASPQHFLSGFRHGGAALVGGGLGRSIRDCALPMPPSKMAEGVLALKREELERLEAAGKIVEAMSPEQLDALLLIMHS